jgi:hypothetical protein
MVSEMVRYIDLGTKPITVVVQEVKEEEKQAPLWIAAPLIFFGAVAISRRKKKGAR